MHADGGRAGGHEPLRERDRRRDVDVEALGVAGRAAPDLRRRRQGRGLGDGAHGARGPVVVQERAVAPAPRAGFHGFVGVRFMQQAIDLFHERHPDTQLQIAVSRQPYSWAGNNRDEDLQGRFTQFAKGGFQQERAARGNEDAEFIPLDVLGEQAGVSYKHGVEMVWQPVDSQRILLWAARFGKQEEIADEIGKLHFEEVESNADRETLLKAVAAVGLDVAAAEAFLDTDEMVDRIWWSYGATINYYGIKEHGLLPYLKHFLGPVWYLAWMMVFIEIISHLVRPASLAIRLYGNISGDHLVLDIFLNALPEQVSMALGFVIPAIFVGLGVFVSFMQAFVFSLLATVYVAFAVAHDH